MTGARHRSRALLLVLGAVAASAFGVLLALSSLVDGQELDTVDTRFELRGDRPPPEELLVVAVDDETFSYLNTRRRVSNWPFPRSYHAKVLDELRRGGARAIGVDIQFTEPTEPEEDTALIEAVAAAKGTVLATTEVGEDGSTNVFGGDDVVRDIGARVGYATVEGQNGGAIYRIAARADGLDTFGFALARASRPGLRPPPQDPAWIDYAGAPGTVPTVSYWEVLEGRVPASAIRGRTVVVGPTASTLQDLHLTPTSGDGFMAGAEVQANAALTFLRGGPLRATPQGVDAGLAALLGLLAPLVALLTRRKLVVRVLPIVAGVVYAVLAQVAFGEGWIVPVVAPLAALAAGYLAALAVDYMATSFERERVYDLFSRFVGDAVVRDVVDRADGARLGGEVRDCTIMFTDLRGFTSFSSRQDPETVIGVVNAYLGEMSEVILRAGGTLVAYMGDGIFAVFGAPVEMADHADRALAAAREMLDEALPRFNASLEERGIDARFRMGIGLNSGPVVAGNVGSERRLEFAAIGDTTNLAARIEAATKGTPHMLLLSDATRERLTVEPDDLAHVDDIELRGANRSVRLWTALDAGEAPEPPQALSAAAATSPNSSPLGRSDGP